MSNLNRIATPSEACEWTMRLPASADGPTIARHQLQETLNSWDLHCIAENAALVASELVTNVFRHGDPPATLRASWEHRRLRLEVQDGSSELPKRRSAAGADGGYGLWLVGAMAEDWGARSLTTGKLVWADFAIE